MLQQKVVKIDKKKKLTIHTFLNTNCKLNVFLTDKEKQSCWNDNDNNNYY